MSKSYDVIVLGGGPAGRAAAILTRRSGASVLIVEKNGFGGTCPLRGCIPKKVLVTAAEVMDEIRKAPYHKIHIEEAHLDWTGLIALKNATIGHVPEDKEKRLKSFGIDTLHGQASFTGRNSISVDGEEFTAKKLVIATGSKPRRFPIPGFEHTLTSDDFLNLETFSRTVIFIGAGPVGMEFAHVLLRAGGMPTLLDASEKILPAFDQELVKELVAYTKSLGAEVIPGARVESISKMDQGFDVTFNAGGKNSTIHADFVVNSAGRIPDIEDLHLDKAGIETGRRGIVLDEFLRSISNPDVFVAGDTVSTSPQLSPLATYEGRIVAHNITSQDLVSPEYQAVPSAVYTIPSLARAGLTEEEAEDSGINFKTAFNNMKPWKVSVIYDEKIALSKILIDSKTDRIVGAHLLGHNAKELINLFALAMKFRISSRDLHKFVFAFPTFSSDIPEMVRIKH